MKLNLGCGTKILSDWENYDLYPLTNKVKKLDIDKLPLPFRDQYADEILLEHVFEHINVNKHYLLKELCRILKNGGRLIISVPLYNDNVLHTKPYFPRSYFNNYLNDDSANIKDRRKIFNKIEVETIPKDFFTKIAQRFGFLEKLFPQFLCGERIFRFVK